jgi:hypothetical protein
VNKKATVPANGFARIHGDPNCGCTPSIADVFSTTNLFWQAWDTLPGRICASFFGTELPGEFGSLQSACFEIQAHRSIVDQNLRTRPDGERETP